MKKYFLICILLKVSIICGFSQIIVLPNYALKSPETIEISKIEIDEVKTVVYLTIENRITEGYFCADQNIYLIQPDGERMRLINSSGIPVCPDTYNFKEVGEKLNFILTFPPLKKGSKWVDLVEDCAENCFSFYEVVLDNNLNRKVDDAFKLAENNQPSNAMISFIKLAEETDINSGGTGGLLYINIIKLAQETGNTLKAAEWYNKLSGSSIPNAGLYIRHLNSQGIKY